MSGDLRVDRVVTSGTFALDGGEWDVDNNIWLVGDDSEVVIVDAAHNADPIVDAVAGRTVVAVICTHGHNDHVTVAPELARRLDAPILLHPADDVLWEQTHPGVGHRDLADGDSIAVAGTTVQVLHTPGHSPGSSCLYLPEAGELFSGDTLFSGGPGATGRSYSDFPTIIGSIRERLFALPPETTVRTGHGDGTTIGTESPHLEEWIARGS
ncbi:MULTISPECIES: MBL fold metallo-hydrolase [Nocardiaceae]|uniref:MBL fold metallo-hydrolase n=1 Tax=Rhodococcoides kroppenstedtii TaxID=293050 RepID=A0ABS7NP79_9NOCA|nr:MULTISPECIES: MBL fold metallo-hydrolase [Rhodococcus]AMY18884.1 putative polyketide biosynthesis zinc-dependent hydrolase BaeB [Rhodococcus sp. PBTS 1]MBY6311958.1 MBL fold metallo-hydrolase [Rhodococcus kroppenstedtii]MBY6319542.1 MBL fold metallo-hydrolase [Rhodococcus kroppenstedtii]MBY6398225.1 MBL fold metallo-hydrolase [Rhodococcus kroppenstedtii]